MNNTLYNFINNHQLRLANIFYSNRHTKGEGALFIDVNITKNNVDVKFLEKKNIPEDVLPLFSKYIRDPINFNLRFIFLDISKLISWNSFSPFLR